MKLTVYLEKGCLGCDSAQRIADEVGRLHRSVDIEVLDLALVSAIPDAVIAVPAYVLDDRLVYLGNPHISEISGLIERSLAVDGRLERAEKA